MADRKAVQGVIAAILTPRTASGSIDFDQFEASLRLAIDQGAAGVCLMGATGEYVRASIEERHAIVQYARPLVPDDRVLSVGAGAATATDSIRYARHASSAGADIVLLPVPFFYRYTQEDVEHFYRTTAPEIPIPVLIYNLPVFTGMVEPPTAVNLIRNVDNIIGIKDSGGIESLALLSSPELSSSVRLVGNDSHLGQALQSGICDGAISGVAGVLPELTVALVEAGLAGDRPALTLSLTLLDELLAQLDQFPAPWGLKLIAARRGLGDLNLSLPLSPLRQTQVDRFERWFDGWWDSASRTLSQLATPNPA